MRADYISEYEDLINILYANQYTGITKQQICDHFLWTPRTVERMLNRVQDTYGSALRREYMQDGSHRRIYRLVMPDMRKMPATFINSANVADLRAAATLIKNNTALYNSINTIAAKLANLNKRGTLNTADIVQTTGVVSIAGPKIPVNPDVVATLQNAILCCNQIEIKYNKKTSTVCPLGILYGIHNNYLVATHHRHPDNPVKYIMSSIESIKVLDTVFDTKNFDMQEYVSRSFGVYMENDTGYDVKWIVAPSAVPDAKKYMFHPTQKMTDNPDGSMTVQFHACGLREMAWHIFTWGGTIVPVAPRELVRVYKDMIKDAQNSLKKK